MGLQRSFDDLGTALNEVTFCVFDLETTGGSPESCNITEIGAVKVRGGEVIGTFQTMVNPGCAIPPEITILTGITHAMVMRAPRIETVLPSFLEFCDGAVMVGHNVRFDLSFTNAALVRSGRPPLVNASVDTVALARRLVRDEVPNCKLSTLASRLRLEHQPSHRALDDAWATVDLLHFLLERAAAFGVCGLDDLLSMHKLGNHPQAAKLKMTDGLPRRPGVYLFRGHRDEVLYVGKATNLRQRVRSYFSSDDRRKIGSLLREVQRIDHVECTSTLEASVMEVRLIHRFLPRFNHQTKGWRKYCYLKLTLGERFPRLSVVKDVRDDGALYLGPLTSTATARQVADAIESVTRLRRCSARVTRRGRHKEALCTAAQLGVAACPCTGELTEEAYRAIVDDVVRGLTDEPHRLLDRLAERMRDLAAAERFEEAAETRDRAGALSRALERQRRIDALRAAGWLHLQLPDGAQARLERGVLVEAWTDGATMTLPLDSEVPAHTGPLPRHLADELTCVSSWLSEHAHRVHMVSCDQGWSQPSGHLPSFAPPR